MSGLPVETRAQDPRSPRWPDPESFRLEHRFDARLDRVQLTGLQALVRLLLDRSGIDAAAGLQTAGFVSGYPGSPLAGFDRELERNAALLAARNIVHLPGVNEELAATSVAGSQLIDSLPNARFTGVTGLWYGKSPGVDRASDALKHGNYAGAHRHGGVVVVAGDDPACKSSSLPSSSVQALHDALMPVVAPGSPQDVVDLGQHAIELSRASGLWVGMAFVTAVADAFGTVDPSTARTGPANGIDGAYTHRVSGRLLPPDSLEMERRLYEVRLPVAREYGYVHRLNEVTVRTDDDWLGVAAPGHTYNVVVEAFRKLGIDDDALRRLGVRLMRIGLPYPMDPRDIRAFADGLRQVLVVEDKRPFVETAVKEALYGMTDAPAVVGKTGVDGRALLPPYGSLDTDQVAAALRTLLADRLPAPAITGGGRAGGQRRSLPLLPVLPSRTPYYCSGCPHNRSTQLPPDSAIGAGIGCHAMTLWMPEEQFGTPIGMTQMGGEGAQWLGLAPFTETSHFFQNVGDGTFFHSAQLAVRAAVAAGAHMTFKLLYNDAMGMTGGQSVAGVRDVPTLVRMLQAEGVTRVIVTTDDVSRYRRRTRRLPPGATLWHRDRLDEAQRVLAETDGVTVLVHDQACAAERRRLRKRGLVEDPPTRVVINPRVCEGCGDCQRASNCLSLDVVDTEFGPKTEVNQSSCNKDYSCLLGDCPSFVTVEADDTTRRITPPEPPASPEPAVVVGDDVRIRLPGVGGTGVVTVSQLLGTAALLDGRYVDGLDQTGLAQKGGPVISDVHISATPPAGAAKAPAGSVDVLLALDCLVALSAVSSDAYVAGSTVAVVNTGHALTSDMLRGDEVYPSDDVIKDSVGELTDPARNYYIDAADLAERLFGDRMPANVLMMGIAYQRGLLPLTSASVERAIELNGAAVKANLAAFRWGRAVVADPASVPGAADPEPVLSDQAVTLANDVLRPLDLAADHPLRAGLARRIDDLRGYQNWGYAVRYADRLRPVVLRDAAAGDGSAALTRAVVESLHKLMAYKDEYEVARLHLDPAFRPYVSSQVGAYRRLRWHLHPPLLRELGLKRKLRLGRGLGVPAYRVLRSMRRLRGTPLDPFGRTAMRRLERELITEYVEALAAALLELDAATYAATVDLAQLPQMIRGYEQVKLDAVERYRTRLAQLREQAPSVTL